MVYEKNVKIPGPQCESLTAVIPSTELPAPASGSHHWLQTPRRLSDDDDDDVDVDVDDDDDDDFDDIDNDNDDDDDVISCQ